MRLLLEYGILTVIAAALTGCAEEEPAPEPFREARSVSSLSPELEAAVGANDQFAWSLYGRVRQAGQNAFFSPISISAALAMTYAGARGETALEMRSVLGINGEDAAYHEAFGALLADLTGEHEGRGYQLYLANRLFAQTDYPFEPTFLEFTEDVYDAPAQEVDYGAHAEAARDTVNSWVSEQTRGKVPELVAPGVFDENTVLALVNAIYFDASWAVSFDEAKTSDGSFLLESGETVSVPMMNLVSRFRVAEDDLFSVLEADYADRELSMLMLLPRERGGLSSVEESLSAERVEALVASLGEQETMLSLPRFELRSELHLEQHLSALGMVQAFLEGEADFTGMVSADAELRENLYLTHVVHEGYVSVDERGTKAAAATAVVAGTRHATPSFVVDQPFVLVIRDKLTSSTLFIGRIADPR